MWLGAAPGATPSASAVFRSDGTNSFFGAQNGGYIVTSIAGGFVTKTSATEFFPSADITVGNGDATHRWNGVCTNAVSGGTGNLSVDTTGALGLGTSSATSIAIGPATPSVPTSISSSFTTYAPGGTAGTQHNVNQRSYFDNSTTDHNLHTYQTFTLAAHSGVAIRSRAVARVTVAGSTLTTVDQVIAAESVVRCYYTGSGNATVGGVTPLYFDGSTGPSSGTPWLALTVGAVNGVLTIQWTKTSEVTDAHLDVEVMTEWDYC
jgi:hypothetical protein